jgi:transcriptional regulator with GAF, ATPase, and Fis domain
MLCILLSMGESKRVLCAETSGSMDIFCNLGPQQVRQLCVHIGRQFSMLINMLETTEDAHRLNLGQATMVGNSPESNLIFASDAMSRVVHLADMAARSDASVLILGETGVGKEVMALHIHRQSPRRNMPFVTVDLSSVPESLVESELFGHERGAFTGANDRRIGQVELADKGTLFIDEVGNISPAVQVKLLRLLQERAYRRVGGAKLLHSDFRLIVATNKDLQSAVQAGRFRDDLYYRLNVISIAIPPLRDRMDDVSCLTEHFLAFFCRKYRRPTPALTSEMERRLREYSWPGNIRELRNIIERVVVLQDDSLPMLAPQEAAPSSSNVLYAGHPDHLPTLDELQTSYIAEVLRIAGGKIAGKRGAAAILGLKRTTLYRKLRKLNICDSRWTAGSDSPK